MLYLKGYVLIFHYFLLRKEYCHLQKKCTELDLAATLHGRFPSSDGQISWFSTHQTEAHHSKSLWSFHIFPPKTLNTCSMQHSTCHWFLKLQTTEFWGRHPVLGNSMFQCFWWLGMTELSISQKHALRKILTYSTSFTELTASSPLCQVRPLGAVCWDSSWTPCSLPLMAAHPVYLVHT